MMVPLWLSKLTDTATLTCSLPAILSLLLVFANAIVFQLNSNDYLACSTDSDWLSYSIRTHCIWLYLFLVLYMHALFKPFEKTHAYGGVIICVWLGLGVVNAVVNMVLTNDTKCQDTIYASLSTVNSFTILALCAFCLVTTSLSTVILSLCCSNNN